VIAPAVEALSKLSEKDICSFQEIMAEKLFAIASYETFSNKDGWIEK